MAFPSSRGRPWLLVLIALAILAPASGAVAQSRRIVVENFSGPQGSQIRGDLVASLRSQPDIELVDRNEVSAMARELGVGNRAYATLGPRLRVAAFIQGHVRRARRRWSLGVTVKSGLNGDTVGSRSWSGRTVGALRSIRRNGYRRLEPLLGQTQAVATPIVADPNAAPWWQGNEEVEIPGAEESSSSVRLPGGHDFLRVGFLLGTIRRSFSADAIVNNNGRDPMAAGPTVPETREYASAGLGHPEVGLSLEVFPGAIPEDQPFPWVGLRLTYQHSLFVSTPACPVTVGVVAGCFPEEEITVDTDQAELYVGLRGRYRVGEERRDLELRSDLGYGLFIFSLDTADLQRIQLPQVIPPMEYSYLHLGVGASYGIEPVYFRAGLDLAYRVGLGPGADAQAVWGVATNDVSGFFADLVLTSEAPYITEGAYFELSLEYFQFSTLFRGQTRCANPPACGMTDPYEPWPSAPGAPDDVTGGIAEPASDAYFRIEVAFGAALR